ncbi:hypothetical protein AKJ09_06966 [Labilithrix luteola]|uniref:Type IV fimbrial biogenesis protein PilY1 n=1 Tax=Labilithrix luteola TaxID=1391654 RepID=A0A0K1Q3J5_9BACT|nr:hypothetical protein [Labilithrix luteola]AKV00303.1 hypothetical protein AKJ09_06966 [Labilithrix luteola]
MRSALSKNVVGSLFLASSIALVGIACSDGEAEDNSRPDESRPDASLGERDASVEKDASDHDADAAPRTCSVDDVCHTALPADSFLRDVWSAGDGVIWAVGFTQHGNRVPTGTVFRWDGSTWTVQYEMEAALFTIWGSSATDIWIGGEGGLFHGTGASSAAIGWTKVRSERIASIWGSSAHDVWAVGYSWQYTLPYQGTVLHFTGGDGWDVDSLTSRAAAYQKVWGTSESDVWLAAVEDNQCAGCGGSRGFVMRRRPDGAGGFTWREDAMPDFGSVGVHSFGSVVTGGASIGDSGASWLFGFDANQHDAFFRGVPKNDGSGNFGWSQGTFGTCRYTTWERGCLGLWLVQAVWGKDPNDVYIAGDFGRLRHWDGTSFSLVSTTTTKIPLSASLFAMWGTSSTDLWIVGDRVALHKVAAGQH